MAVINILKLQEPYNGWLGIWELTENCNELLANFEFTDEEKKAFEKISNEKRKCEFLAVRIMLQELMQKKKVLVYDSEGKPLLEDNTHISIAHSSELVVVLISEIRAGIDVENVNRSTEKIASRFLSEKELQHIESTSNQAYARIIYWCAKEALFKCTPLADIDFKKHIEIKPFMPGKGPGSFYGQLHKNNHHSDFVFHYFLVNNNVVVYCIEDIKDL
jgi:4'-phosphopantetheinyl transferase